MTTSRTGTAAHKQFRTRVLARDRSRGITNCPDCGVTLDYTRGRKPNSAEPDHITPHARGGTDTVDNGRTICRRCNQSRGARGAGQTAPEAPKEPRTTTNLVQW